jgi:hypothetical protein
MDTVSIVFGAVVGFFLGALSSFSGKSQSLYVGVAYGNILQVNGRRITSSSGGKTLPEAKSLRLIAIDENGKELDDFSLPANCEVKILFSVGEGSIDEVKALSANITVENVHRINTLSCQSGDIKIKEVHGDIHEITTVSGDVKVESVVNLGRTSTISGDIKVRNLSGTRDRSPKGKKNK